jgi:heme/copper-type cytochrome/quinol oxidase subunit 3
MIDSGITDIQIQVANVISSLLLSMLIIYALLQIQTMEKLMKDLNDIPFLSGMICTFGLGTVCLALDPTHYKHFTDYTLTFVTVPLGAYFFIITLWSRTKYSNKTKTDEP